MCSGQRSLSALWRPLLRNVLADDQIQFRPDGCWFAPQHYAVPTSGLGDFVAIDVETTGMIAEPAAVD